MVDKINTIMSQMPSSTLMSKVAARSGQVGSPEAELRKLLGEPVPKAVDPKNLPRELQALFATYGMLQKIKKKLEWISKRKGGKIIPAENTIACIDGDDNLYMGVDFLLDNKNDEDLIAGIMSHEWGHLQSELTPGMDLSHLSWDDMHAVRREEEANADAFAGRSLYQMGYEVDQMIAFLENFTKIDKSVATQKYHSPQVRTEILRQAYAAQKRAMEQLNKMFGKSMGFINPVTSRLIAIA